MSHASTRLNDADACHDEDPPHAATLLRDIDALQLDAGDRPRLAFLLNHVLGERLGAWDEAHARQQALLRATGDEAPAVLWRQAAAAARLAGDVAAEAIGVDRLAGTTGTSVGQAAQLVALAAAGFRAPSLPADEAGRAVLDVLRPLQRDAAWQRASGLDAAAAACCNNLSVALSERPLAALGVAPLREAMADTAELAERLWQRAGTWVHHERACYQRAVVANTLGEPQAAQAHARQGLALLDANDGADEEFVDRAFLALELAHACERLGVDGEAASARDLAQRLATRFDDEGLARWFSDRRTRLEALKRV